MRENNNKGQRERGKQGGRERGRGKWGRKSWSGCFPVSPISILFPLVFEKILSAEPPWTYDTKQERGDLSMSLLEWGKKRHSAWQEGVHAQVCEFCCSYSSSFLWAHIGKFYTFAESILFQSIVRREVGGWSTVWLHFPGPAPSVLLA